MQVGESNNSAADNRPLGALHPAYDDYAYRDSQWVFQRLALVDGEFERKVRVGQRELFPVKLHTMLEDCSSTTGLSVVIRWLPHGRAFKIYDRERFVAELLPRYFQTQRAYGSFQRQLNMYGLLKLTGEHIDNGAYYHPLLLRGRPSLSHLLVRRDETESAVRRRFDPRSEPDFYRMPPLHTRLPPNHAYIAPTRPDNHRLYYRERNTAVTSSKRVSLLDPPTIVSDQDVAHGAVRAFSMDHSQPQYWANDDNEDNAEMIGISANDSEPRNVASASSNYGNSEDCHWHHESLESVSPLTFSTSPYPQVPILPSSSSMGTDYAGFAGSMFTDDSAARCSQVALCECNDLGGTQMPYANVQVSEEMHIGETKARWMPPNFRQEPTSGDATPGSGLKLCESRPHSINDRYYSIPVSNGHSETTTPSDTSNPALLDKLHIEKAQCDDGICGGEGGCVRVNNMGIFMPLDEAMAACDRDDFAALFFAEDDH